MERTRKIWNNPWVVASCNLLMIMAIYTLMRLFFYYIHHDWFEDLSLSRLREILAGGMRFDLSALLYLNSLYLILMLIPIPLAIRSNRVYQYFAKLSYSIPNAVGLFASTADIIYVAFNDRRMTMGLFSEVSNDDNTAQIIQLGALGYWHVTIVGIAAILAVFFLCRTMRFDRTTWRPARYIAETICFCVTIYMTVIGIRGGFGAWTRPLNMQHANAYATTSHETMLVLNAPFCLMQTINSEFFVDPQYYEDPSVYVQPIHHKDNQSEEVEQIAKRLGKKNVVVIIAESFGKEYFGFYNPDEVVPGTGAPYNGFTPFLDSLCAESVTYKYSYASGRKSIDAMPSILSSIPCLIEPYFLTPYASNRVESLASHLSGAGYQTAFFHGAPNGSMGFQAYARVAGYQRYYGMDEYDGPEAFDGTWAIWDEEFLQYFARTLDTLPEPFMTTVFTASSHHPFRVPKQYAGQFDKGWIELHQCIGYSDLAFRKFFEHASQQPWFEHTLFVFSADHTNINGLRSYNGERGQYSVPIFFYSKDLAPRKDSTTVISQTDIMPSVLEYLGYNRPYFGWGEDALTQSKTHNWAICYDHPYFVLFAEKGILRFDGTDVIEDTTDDPEALPYLKAYVQDYIQRMTRDNLTWQK